MMNLTEFETACRLLNLDPKENPFLSYKIIWYGQWYIGLYHETLQEEPPSSFCDMVTYEAFLNIINDHGYR